MAPMPLPYNLDESREYTEPESQPCFTWNEFHVKQSSTRELWLSGCTADL